MRSIKYSSYKYVLETFVRFLHAFPVELFLYCAILIRCTIYGVLLCVRREYTDQVRYLFLFICFVTVSNGLGKYIACFIYKCFFYYTYKPILIFIETGRP